MAEEGFKRKLAAILSADVEGYSRLMGDDEEATIRTLTTYRNAMTDLIQQFRGRLVDATGDNLLAEFSSVVDAVNSAVEIQREIAERNADLPYERKMEFRIGVNLGDVVEEEGRIYGDGVNIAARVEGLAEAGGICISGRVYDQVENKLGLEYENLGEHEVKNIARPIRVYRVLSFPGAAAHRVVQAKEEVGKRWRKLTLTAISIVVVATIAFVVWNSYFRLPSIEPASVEKMAFPLPDKPSIAVLPFVNMSGNTEEEFVADGISENIITALSKNSRILVISRTSTFVYKNKPVKVQQVAEELGVRYVLEGSIQRVEDQIRVTAQLIDAVSGYHLWADKYDRDLDDFFALQDEITKKIVVEMNAELVFGDTGYSAGSDNFDAWGYYIKGITLLADLRKDGNLKARDYFERAIKLDSKYAHAWAGLGWTHYIDSRMGYSESRTESFKQAFKFAQKALKFDEPNVSAHQLLGVLYLLQGNHTKSIASGEKSIAYNPNNASGYAQLGRIMRYAGRPEEAIKLIKKGMRLSPFYPLLYLSFLSSAYNQVGRYEDAISTLKHMHNRILKGERWSLSSWHLEMCAIYMMLGKKKEARKHAEEALKLKPYISLDKYFKRSLKLYKNPKSWVQYIDALRKAGLPDKPPLPLPDKPSIAVLPFTNMSGDPEQDYFSDGMTEDLITDLSKISGLFVIARNSTFQYKGKAVDVKKVSRDLGIRYVLEGSVRRAGEKIRINAQLIDAITGGHLWAERYDRDYHDIFALQDEVIKQIVSSLAVKFSMKEKELLAHTYTNNLEAYEYYLRGRQTLHSFSAERLINAKMMFKEAIKLDPKFAHAYAAHALADSRLFQYTLVKEIRKSRKEAYEFITKALDLNSNLPLAFSVLAGLQLTSRLYDEAIKSAKKSLFLDPNNPDNLVMYAYILWAVGKHEEALKTINKAFRLNPKAPPFYKYYLGLIQSKNRQYKNAIKSMSEFARAMPWSTFPDYTILSCYGHLGMKAESKKVLEKLLAKTPQLNIAFMRLGALYRREEDTEHYAEGLRKAGVAELPYGFEGSKEDMLTESEIKALHSGRTTTGIDPVFKGQWWQYHKNNGEVVMKSSAWNLTGTYRFDDRKVCYKWKNLFFGRPLCGRVFRNPKGKAKEKNEFIWAGPLLRYFSIDN